MSGLGERGTQLRAIARQLPKPPEVPPFYVESPDELELRARGWYMRLTRDGEAIFLGHSATAAMVWLRLESKPGGSLAPARVRKSRKKCK